MHVDQSLKDMLNGPVRGNASTCANRSQSSGQKSKPSDSANKASQRDDGRRKSGRIFVFKNEMDFDFFTGFQSWNSKLTNIN